MLDLNKIFLVSEMRIRQIDTDSSLLDIKKDEVVSTIQVFYSLLNKME